MRRAAPLAAALILAVAFRLPPMINANALNSDAAIVGLQARHLLVGDWSLRLWGAPYQASLDALLAAPLLALGGSSAFLLLLVPLLGMLLMISLTYAIVSRHVGPLGALLSVLPLVFATQAVNSPMTYVLRQSLATWAVFAVCCFEFAPQQARRPIWFGLGGALVGLGLFIDTFFAVLIPPLLLFGALRAWTTPARSRTLAVLGGAFLFCLVLSLALMRGGPAAGTALSVHVFARNAVMLWNECLPFALGTRVWLPGSVEWMAPGWLHVLQIGAAMLFVGALASGAVLGLRTRAHSLGMLGVAAGLTALGGFLFSSAPFDMWSTRYLAPILWFAPFALTPLVVRFGAARASVLVGPWALSALVSGWVSYGPFVDGTTIVMTERGAAAPEFELGRVLRERGVHHARAQYWQSYRLSLLWREDPLVVPLEPDLDRSPAMRKSVEDASVVAAIFHPSEPRASASDFEAGLVAEGARYERLEIEGFTVLIVRR